MADFDLEVTAGASVVSWDDPASATRPSRLNPAEVGFLYYRCAGAMVEVIAKTGNVYELDAALGGELFTWYFAEKSSSAGPMSIISPAGQSAMARFTLPAIGGYLLVAMRPGHGRVAIHLRRE